MQFRSYKISESRQLVMSHVQMMPTFIILLSSHCLLASTVYCSTSNSKDLNVWQQTSEWQCNTPSAQDHLALALYRRESRPEEKFLLLFGRSLSETTVSGETWSFSLQSKVTFSGTDGYREAAEKIVSLLGNVVRYGRPNVRGERKQWKGFE